MRPYIESRMKQKRIVDDSMNVLSIDRLNYYNESLRIDFRNNHKLDVPWVVQAILDKETNSGKYLLRFNDGAISAVDKKSEKITKPSLPIKKIKLALPEKSACS